MTTTALQDHQHDAYYWFRPRPDQPERFDQQTAFVQSQTKGVKWLIGGNGAGTTTCCLYAMARFLLTTPPPRADTPFWLISNDFQTVMEACWKEKIKGMGIIPKAEIDFDRIAWFRENQDWPSRVPLKEWAGRPGKNWVIEFRSYDQGRARLQARSIGGFAFVEQFPWVLLTEVLRGCREYNFPGSKMCEFTPVDPNLSTELEEMIEEDRLPASWEIYRANTECAVEAGHVDREWFEEFFGTISDEMRQTRLTGAFATYEGAIYQGLNPTIHFVGDDEITFPPNCHYRRAIDWGGGPSNAFVCLWAYRNGMGQWFVYDEYYSTAGDRSTVEHLYEVQDRWPWPLNNPHYGTTYADPSDPDNFKIAAKLSEYTKREQEPRENLWITPAANSVLEGIEHVRWLLKPDLLVGHNGSAKRVPRLFIHKKNCPNLCRQLRTYRWLRGSEMGINPHDARKQPLKLNDHTVDALRYLTFSEARITGAVPEAKGRAVDSKKHGVHLHGRSDLQRLQEMLTNGREGK